ncbi:MAG: Ig-like domain-containing protein [Erysipelotrichales bacterium]|nr:Ig-like domain-containing protein [Erysipelotrichales bacterium]
MRKIRKLWVFALALLALPLVLSNGSVEATGGQFTGWVFSGNGNDYRLYTTGIRLNGEPINRAMVGYRINDNAAYYYLRWEGATPTGFARVFQYAEREHGGMEGGILFALDITLAQGESTRLSMSTLNWGSINGIRYTVVPQVQVNLVADPWNHLAGTEVTMNNGSRHWNRMTQGFTRILYIGEPGEFLSRRNFNFTSSNPAVATVTEYGTVFARSPGTTTITALSDNTAQIGSITITVLPDNSQVQRIIVLTTDTRLGGDQGSQVTSGLGLPGERTVNVDMTRHISFSGQVPSPLIQDYIWLSSDPSIATISQFGTITAIRPGTVTITGVFRYNHRFSGSIVITVLP